MGVVLVLAVTITLAGTLAVFLGGFGLGTATPPHASFDISVDADGTIALQHEAGDPIDVTELSIVVSIDGEELDEQPPVPFFAATGFVGGPEGPFNEAADPVWTVGEVASFQVASTNEPSIDAGDEVRVILAVEDGVVATLETTAE